MGLLEEKCVYAQSDRFPEYDDVTMPSNPGTLSVVALMTKGYFPDRVIPPVNSHGLLNALADITAYATPIMTDMVAKKPTKFRSRCITHSVPKRKHLRRSLAIPNPLHQLMVAMEVSFGWADLHAFCSQSPVALSSPAQGLSRALVPLTELGKQPLYRAQRSVGKRYLLKTDIARFYPSIYTHSIPWALHGETNARNDKKYQLPGNRLDLWIRESQDKQTGGIPIGPDTSFLIGEVIGTTLDMELAKKFPNLSGTRSIDDYYLYFPTVSEAETALAVIHGIAKQYELEINDPKTEIIQLPDTFEPPWKSDLRALNIRPTRQPQATDLLSLFDRAFEHARRFPADSVLTYAAKQVLSAEIVEENWDFCEALLLRAAVSEPTMLSVLEDIYDKFIGFHKSNASLTTTLESICSYHAPLQQGNEVSWALWLAKRMDVSISKPVADLIAAVDDDIVALVALDLIEQGKMNTAKLGLWKGYTTASNLYEDHWLLAYEAHEHGWLSTPLKTDYVAADPFFSILQGHGTRFYGESLAETDSYYEYGDDSTQNDDITDDEVDDDDDAVAII
jgi:hypothetical protein